MRKFFALVQLLTLATVLAGSSTVWAQAVSLKAADPKIEVAYQSLRFSSQYPPEAVQFIAEQLRDASPGIGTLQDLAGDERSEVRVLVAMLLGEAGYVQGGKTLWSLLQDRSEAVTLTASAALLRLREFGVVPLSMDGLKDERPNVRRFTVATLSALGTREIEPTFVAALEDPDERVRMEAARALVRCGTKQAVPSLINKLDDKSVLVRTAVVEALGVLGSRDAIGGLTRALYDPDWHVRARAILSLAGLCKDPTEGAALGEAFVSRLQLDDFSLVRDRAADALVCRQDEKAVQAMVQALVNDSCDVRVHVARTICNSRLTAALPYLALHAYHEDPQVREKVVEIFGHLGGRDQLPVLADATSDPDTGVRLAAVAALRKLQQRGGTDVLLAKLSDANPHVRAATVRLLGDMGDKALAPKILPLLRDESSYVRSATAEALGRLGDRSAVQPLIAMLTGEGVVNRNDSGGGLVISATNDFFKVLAEKSGPEMKKQTMEALGVLRAQEAVDPIAKFGLTDADPIIRAVAAYALGKIGDERAVLPLQNTVKPYYDVMATMPEQDNSPTIKIGSNALPDTERIRIENEARVRATVAWALGQIVVNDSSAETILRAAANDQNSLVRDAAQEAISKILARKEQVASQPLSKPSAKR